MKTRKILLLSILVICFTCIILAAYSYWNNFIREKTEDDYIDIIYNYSNLNEKQDAIWHLGRFKSAKSYFVLVSLLNGPVEADRVNALASLEDRKEQQTCFYLLPLMNDDSFPQDILMNSLKSQCSCKQLVKVRKYILKNCGGGLQED